MVEGSYMKKGFTLLELLVVIAVAAILVSVATAAYTSAQVKARDSRRMSDMKSMQNALEQFYSDNTAYPAADASNLPVFPVIGTYLPAGLPSEIKATQDAYHYSNPSATTATYCMCADVENAVGNATDTACTGFGSTTGGTHYCVRNLQ
jgi:prepilin-type N-terminal cleavage/methylation domain-containing protein